MEAKIKNGFFSTRRFGRLLLRELAGSYRSLLIAMGAVGGAVILLSALTVLGITRTSGGAGGEGFYLNYFINLLFLGGFIITSLAFREVWQTGGGIFYLALPGSTFEKFSSKLLITTVGFAVGSAVFMTVIAVVSQLINSLLFGIGMQFGDVGAQLLTALKMMGIYAITQSVFLLGSIWFRKTAFIRTVLWIVIVGVGLGIVALVTARVAMPSIVQWQHGFRFDTSAGTFAINGASQVRVTSLLEAMKIVACVLFYASAPACWLATYFRLGEAEV
jgi:hypothetical protein